MLVQRIITLGIIIAAAVYIIRSLARKGKSHSDSVCGKCGCGDEHKAKE